MLLLISALIIESGRPTVPQNDDVLDHAVKLISVTYLGTSSWLILNLKQNSPPQQI